MTKSKISSKKKSNSVLKGNRVLHPVALALGAAYISYSLRNSTDSTLSNFTNYVLQILAFLLIVFAIDIYFSRKTLTHQKLINNLLNYSAVAVLWIGWLMTSYSEGPYHIQNDGYSVTGGFLMFISGIYLGYRISNGKK